MKFGRKAFPSSAVTSAVTLDLVQQLGTERLEVIDDAVPRQELTFEPTNRIRRSCSLDDRQH